MVWVVGPFTTDVSARCVSPEYHFRVFGVCMELVGRDGPLLQTVLYPPECSLEALPKLLSGRTSYRQPWLAFHSYPQLTDALLQQWFVRTSNQCYLVFILVMDRSTGFGSIPSDCDARLRLGFPTAPLCG